MVSRAVTLAVGLAVRQARQNVDMLLHRFERSENRRQVVPGSHDRGFPLVQDHAVGDVYESQPGRRRRRLCRECGHHCVQHRQRKRGAAESLKERPAR